MEFANNFPMSALKQEFHHWQFRGTVFEQAVARNADRNENAQIVEKTAINNPESQQKIVQNRVDLLQTEAEQAVRPQQNTAIEAANTDTKTMQNVQNQAHPATDAQDDHQAQVIRSPKFEQGGVKKNTANMGIGQVLKERREEYEVSETQAATVLNMRLGQLRAIEEGRFQDLPGKVYTIGFIRSYAKFLNIDAEYAVQKFKEETGTISAKEEILTFPVPATESRTPDTRIIAVSIAGILALILITSLFLGGSDDSAPLEIPAAEIVADEVATDKVTVAETVSEAPVIVADTVTQAEPAPTETVIPEVSTQERALSNADTRPTIYGAANIDARVILRSLENSWIEIHDGNGATLLTRVLKPGDLYYLPNRDGITLTTGNAGGLEVIVDGTSRVAIGQRGQVLRSFDMSPKNLLKQ